MDFHALEKNSRVEGFGPDAEVVRCGDKYCFAAIAGRCSARHGAWEILVALHATLCRLQRAQGRGPTCVPYGAGGSGRSCTRTPSSSRGAPVTWPRLRIRQRTSELESLTNLSAGLRLSRTSKISSLQHDRVTQSELPRCNFFRLLFAVQEPAGLCDRQRPSPYQRPRRSDTAICNSQKRRRRVSSIHTLNSRLAKLQHRAARQRSLLPGRTVHSQLFPCCCALAAVSAPL